MASRFLTAEPVRRGEYSFTVNRGLARSWDRENSIELPMEWAFGSGKQAVTFVTRVNGEWYVEHAMSYYPALAAFGLTPGHGERKPRDLKEASGVLYKITDPQHGIAGCFECHTTGAPRFDSTGAVQVKEEGVRCEACHPAAASHIARKAKAGPGRMTAVQINDFCGRCHRPPSTGAAKVDWNYAWNVRHQPVYLNESKCFLKSNGRLSCLTCHSPHAPMEVSTAAYNAKCSGCHAKPAASCSSNCVDCHMPRVSPQQGLRFANHWIGVYGEGSRLKPRQR